MKEVTIDAIELELSVDDELCEGTMKVLLTKKGIIFVPSAKLEGEFTKEEYKNLKNQIRGKLGQNFHKPMEVWDLSHNKFIIEFIMAFYIDYINLVLIE